MNDLNSSFQSQNQLQNTQVAHTVDAGGQDHDRMDTDDASETSGPGEEPLQQGELPVGESFVVVPAVPDAEAMDTTPDTPDAGNVRLPSSPRMYSIGSFPGS